MSMRNIGGVILFSILFLLSCSLENNNYVKTNTEYLWYDEPAKYFTEALPIGNGRLAAMVYGKPDSEIIHLNEETLWTGGPIDLNPNPRAKDYIPLIREALSNKDYRKADSLSHYVQGYFTQSYAPVGDLCINQLYDGDVKDYKRKLDLRNGIVSSEFKVNNVSYCREAFVTYPDQAIIMKFTSSESKSLFLNFSLNSKLRSVITEKENELIMSGNAPSHADPVYMSTSDTPVRWDEECKGMRFQTRLKILDNDGVHKFVGDTLCVSNASNLTLAISIATSFNGYDKCPVNNGVDEKEICRGYLSNLNGKDYSELRKRHINDYQHYYDKVDFYIEGDSQLELLPTDDRLERYSKGSKDNGLESLLFNYGRYLLISSSRSNAGKGIAANLQGKWNKDLQPAWSCNYTVNINLQMNYWAADKLGLSDMAKPLIKQISNMSKTGEYTSRNFLGCRGWASGHNSDIWATTNPVGHFGKGDCQWANWYMASPWLCQYLWDRYLYLGDIEYLSKTAYPIMKSASEFCRDWLVYDKDGHLTTSPSTSPENKFKDHNGEAWAVTVGSTMDLALIRDLFKNTISAARILGRDISFSNQLSDALSLIAPYPISDLGYLQEWSEDYEELDPKHRHVSHLYALHPGTDVSLWQNSELFNACKKTLERRGDEGTGWSRAWKICFWARLLDGNHAYQLLRNTLNLTKDRGFSESGGTYPNMLNACPPFQIDGNFGILEGISEMLVQSHTGELFLLPALPKSWQNGYINNIQLRGGYLCSINWHNGSLYEAKLLSQKNNICKLRTLYPVKIDGINDKSNINQRVEIDGIVTYLSVFNTEGNKSYKIRLLYEN